MKRGVPIVVLALVVAACGGGEPFAAPVEPIAVEKPEPKLATPPTLNELPQTPGHSRPVYQGFDAELSVHDSYVAMTRGDTAVFATPGDESAMLTIPFTTILGTITVRTVIGEPVDGWAQVMLPVRPNGTTGWVRIEDVDLYLVQGRIVIDLSDRHLTYLFQGEEMLSATVAVGTAQNPTPTGTFFVTDSVAVKPDGPWGPYALGLSARSDTITEYNGGDGIIGIHGTNRPSTIGTAASLPNELITLLHGMVPIGTPVEIRA